MHILPDTIATNVVKLRRYVAIVIYQGLIEDVSTFDSVSDATAWVATLRQVYGWEDTADSLTWDTRHQTPVTTQALQEHGKLTVIPID